MCSISPPATRSPACTLSPFAQSRARRRRQAARPPGSRSPEGRQVRLGSGGSRDKAAPGAAAAPPATHLGRSRRSRGSSRGCGHTPGRSSRARGSRRAAGRGSDTPGRGPGSTARGRHSRRQRGGARRAAPAAPAAPARRPSPPWRPARCAPRSPARLHGAGSGR